MEERICPKYILWPNENSQANCKSYFYEKNRFPGIIGCVDGTHVNIVRPNTNEHLFYNRKGKHSINVMIVCDHNMRIIAEDCRYGGASHDSFVWSGSVVRRNLMRSYENGERNTWLLGDSGYSLEPWLITPFRSSEEGSRESRFNSKHAQARNTIERTNGLLKSRFRCLLAARELHYSPRKASQIINVCCALHNICLNFNVPFEEIEEGAGRDLIETQNVTTISTNQTATAIRNEILNSIIR